MSDAPLRLYWWKAVPNFGDALSQLVVAHVSGREVVNVGPRNADLWAIGSLMHVARNNRDTFNRRPVIWGTGQLGHVPRDVVPAVDIALLRGPIGAALLGVRTDRFGDPGLLVRDTLGEPPARRDRIGVVPHHTLLDDPLLAALIVSDPVFELIDVRDDCARVCRQIASCAHVCASSLHGLIVADAYGVPNTWLVPEGQGHFKYYDYAASIGRALPLPVALDQVADLAARLPQDDIPYADGIAAAKEALYATFPSHLQGNQDMGHALNERGRYA